MDTAVATSKNMDQAVLESDDIVAYAQEGVFIHLCSPETTDDVILGGALKIFEKNDQQYLQWTPCESHLQRFSSVDESAQAGGCKKSEQGVSTQEITSKMRLAAVDCDFSENSDPSWTVVNKQNQSDSVERVEEATPQTVELAAMFPQYDFTVALDDLSSVKKSKKNVGWKYLVLQLDDGAYLPPLHFHQGGCKKFLKALKKFLVLTPSEDNPMLISITSPHAAALHQSLNELNVFGSDSFPAEIFQHPVQSAWSGFSRVTNFLQEVFNPQEIAPQTRPASERASMLNEDAKEPGQLDQNADGTGGFEVIACANNKHRSDPPRLDPVNENFWLNHKDKEGRITNVEEVKLAIFKGGVVPDLRKEVWKYLLGYYCWNMTETEAKEHRHKMEERYYRIKMQWKSIDQDQEKRFSALRDQKSLIEKDVNRTDRKRLFYEGNENISLKMLFDVLVTYVMYNFDLGYVQGMSDLLSPILEVMESEVDAFWCFVGFMDIVEHNFDKNQNGMKKQLRDLRSLIQYVDPYLYDNLTEKESNNFYFCFRWLLLRFKREFTFEDIQTLWEVLWTGLPCPNFHLLICVSILDTEKSTLLREDCGFNEILKHINDLSEKIDLDATLSKADGIYNQLSICRSEVSDVVCDVLGLNLQR